MEDLPVTIEELVNNRTKFNEVIYTNIEDAIAEINRRATDKELEKKVHEFLNGDIPKQFDTEFRAAIFRHLCTPNYELHRFINIVDALDWKPIFFTYEEDKFTSNNFTKYYLGKMAFHLGHGKKGGAKMEYRNIIDFNKSNGKKIKEVTTVWGNNLVDFHHTLFEKMFTGFNSHIFNASEWFHRNGGSAKDYYQKFLSLFIRNGILFENFMLDESEKDFTETVFLPSFFACWKMFGVKPLIVALEPTDIEGDHFWLSYPHHIKEKIEKDFDPK